MFSRIWTEYGDLICKFRYSVRIRENTDPRELQIRKIFKQNTEGLEFFLACTFISIRGQK